MAAYTWRASTCGGVAVAPEGNGASAIFPVRRFFTITHKATDNTSGGRPSTRTGTAGDVGSRRTVRKRNRTLPSHVPRPRWVFGPRRPSSESIARQRSTDRMRLIDTSTEGHGGLWLPETARSRFKNSFRRSVQTLRRIIVARRHRIHAAKAVGSTHVNTRSHSVI